MRKRVAIIGAGNGGQSAAFQLSQKGLTIHLCDVDVKIVEGIKDRGGIHASGKLEGFTRIPLVTTQLGEAVEGVEAILPMVPRYAHRGIAENLLPYLKKKQRILLCPGSTTGELEFARVLRENGRDSPVSTVATLPYASRLQGPGDVFISLVAKTLFFATFPGRRTKEEAEYFQDFFGGITPVTNALEVGLNNGNPITHPAPTLLNTARIERRDEFLFYREGISPAIANINQQLDKERLTLCRGLGFREIPLTERLFLTGYTDRIYDSPLEAYHQSKAFASIPAPNSLQHRYITEDIPYGLVTFASLGEYLGISTPTIDLMIELAHLIFGIDFWTNGMTLSKLGLNRMGSADLNRFMEEGESPFVDWSRIPLLASRKSSPDEFGKGG